jgi:choline kinase
MKVIILAAGRGSRLGSETENKPKCLTEFRGEALLSSALKNLEKFFNRNEIFLVGGYKIDLLRHAVDNIIPNFDWEKTNIVGSLICADHLLANNECLIVYSDIYFEESAISLMVRSEAPAVLSVTNWLDIWKKRFTNVLEDVENFKFDHASYSLTHIGGRALSLESIEGQFGGLYTLTPSAWEVIKNGISNLGSYDTTTMLQEAIQLGVEFKVIEYPGFWAEIDSQNDRSVQT